MQDFDNIVDPRPNDESQGVKEPGLYIKLEWNTKDVEIISLDWFCDVALISKVLRDTKETCTAG